MAADTAAAEPAAAQAAAASTDAARALPSPERARVSGEMPELSSSFHRFVLPGLARKHDAIAAALAAEELERQRVKELHATTDKAYKELHRHARETHKEKTRENFSMEKQLEFAITTELKLRNEVERLERALELTQHDLGNARYELSSLGEEWRLDEGRARSLVRTHELGHLQLCDHLESAVDALGRWRGDGERICDALEDALDAVRVQRATDEGARTAREMKAVGGSTKGLGNAAAAEQRALATEVAQQRAFCGEIKTGLEVWGERETAWTDSLPVLRAEFAGALYAAQLHQQQELSALILKSPEKRRELQTRLKEIHDHREAVCGVWPNLNIGSAPAGGGARPQAAKSAKSGKPAAKSGRRAGAGAAGASARASPARASPARASPARNLTPMKTGKSLGSPVRTPPAQGRRAVQQTSAAANSSLSASYASLRAEAGATDLNELKGTPSIATTKRVNRFNKAPSAVATGHRESAAIVIAAGTIEKTSLHGRPNTPGGDRQAALSGGGRRVESARTKRPGSAASLAGSVPVWKRPDSAGSVVGTVMSGGSRPSTAGDSRPGTARSYRPGTAGRRPPTPEQVASQSTVRTTLTTHQQQPRDEYMSLENGDASVEIGAAMVESPPKGGGVWRNAGRPDDDSEMVRQILALRGIADAAENVLPPVLLLARADNDVDALDDEEGADEDDDDGDAQALRLNRFEWGTEEWSQATLVEPHYTVRSKDGFSANVVGFDPSTACSATLLRPRALGRTDEHDVGALVVCGEVALDEATGEEDHHVLQIYEPPSQEWAGLPGPMVSRRFPVLLGLADGALLLLCGYDKGGSLIKSAELLHQKAPPSAHGLEPRKFGEWKSAGKLSAGRDGFAVGQLEDGRVIVAGGTHYPFGVVESGLKTAEMYVPASKSWQKLPSMNEGHGYCAGCRMADGRFMVSGGYDPQGVPSTKVEAYNPETFGWDALADLPRPARDHKMCAVPGGVLLTTVGGGAMLYDVETDHWNNVSRDDKTRFQPLMLHCETGDAE